MEVAWGLLTTPTWITADAILDGLAVAPRSRRQKADGHYRAALQLIAASMKRLDRLWIGHSSTQIGSDPEANPYVIQCPTDKLLILHDFRATWWGPHQAYAYAWSFAPGGWLLPFANPAVTLQRSFIQRYKERSWEKRLGYFLAALFAASYADELHPSLQLLLSSVGLPPLRHIANKQATQQKFRQVMTNLQAAKIIGAWADGRAAPEHGDWYQRW